MDLDMDRESCMVLEPKLCIAYCTVRRWMAASKKKICARCGDPGSPLAWFEDVVSVGAKCPCRPVLSCPVLYLSATPNEETALPHGSCASAFPTWGTFLVAVRPAAVGEMLMYAASRVREAWEACLPPVKPVLHQTWEAALPRPTVANQGPHDANQSRKMPSGSTTASKA